MRQLASIAWKEWHELRIFLWIALGVFIGLPVAGGIEALANAPMHRFEILSSPWVIALGGVLSVFIAIGASCRDFSGHLEDFWRSRPIGVVRWLLIKYAIGLLVVLAGCLLPLYLEYWIDAGRESDATVYLLFPFHWIAIYSLAFLAGCLVRRTAHAAMLGLAAMLLVYFLPMVLPPLSWMDIAEAADGISPYIHDNLVSILRNTPLMQFGGGMLAVSAAALLTAIAAVRADWHVDSGRKMMYGSVSAALLILFSSAGFQLGTNLPVLAQADLPDEGQIFHLDFDGQHGTVVFEKYIDATPPANTYSITAHSIDLTASGLEVGPGEKTGWGWSGDSGISTHENPDIQYQWTNREAPDKHIYVSVNERGKSLRTVQLTWEFDPDDHNAPWPRIYAWNNRLYVYGTRLITLDITDPRTPRVISDEPFNAPRWDFPFGGIDIATVDLPQLPDLPPIERFRAHLSRWGGYAFDGEILCTSAGNGQGLGEYRLTEITDTRATFNKIAEYKASMLEQLFGRYGYRGIMLENGLLYVLQGGYGGTFEPVISIFDTAGPRPLHPIAHFAAPSIEVARPLPDGRALVAGRGKLWLVGTPKR